jgi:hypothetical protein
VPHTKKAPANFAQGDTVRVRSGVTDPDFPDIPLGGWAGKITEVEEGNASRTTLTGSGTIGDFFAQ